MVDGFSCILDFPKFSGGGPPDPLIKGIYRLNPQNLSSTTTAAKGKEKESFVCVEVLRPSQQLRSCRAGQLPINTVPGQATKRLTSTPVVTDNYCWVITVETTIFQYVQPSPKR